MKKGNKKDGLIVLDTYSRWFNFILIAICFLVLLAVRSQQNQNTTGDEPYYLLMDYSLVHDHDLALANNYQHKDFMNFYLNTELGVEGQAVSLPQKYGSNAYSVHGTGLPLLLYPGFLIAAKTGATFTMILVATLVVCLTWLWAKNITGNRKIAYLASALLVICYFFNYLAGAIYPDMLMAAISLGVLIMLERYYKTNWHQIIIGLLLGFLILVHFKAVVFIGPALLVLAYRHWKEERKLPWISVAIVAAFTAYYYITLYQWFGLLNLSKIEGGQSFGANPFHNISAMLFDSNRGLLIYNPILALIAVGLPLWFKKNRKSFVITSLALLPTIAVLCVIPNWNGSAAPTGRYIMEFLPAFIPAIVFAIIELRKVWQRAIIFVLGALTFLISLDATMMRFPYLTGGIIPPRPLLFTQIERHTGWALDRLLPSYNDMTVLAGSHGYLKLALGYLGVITLLGYGIYVGYFNKFKKRTA